MTDPVAIDTQLATLGMALQRQYAQRVLLDATAKRREERGLAPAWTPSARADYAAASAEIERIRAEMEPLEATYRAAPWTRWFPCTNAGGHLHISLGCSSLYPTTSMAWRTDLSGRSAESVVAEFGTDVCSVCVPEAPALKQPEYGSITQRLTEMARAKRAAKREAKAAKVAANTLVAPVTDMHGWKVRTVTEARSALKGAMPYALNISSAEGLREGLKADADAAFARLREALVLKLGEEAVAEIVARMEKAVRREWRR